MGMRPLSPLFHHYLFIVHNKKVQFKRLSFCMQDRRELTTAASAMGATATVLCQNRCVEFELGQLH
jgi:hypothetical protein